MKRFNVMSGIFAFSFPCIVGAGIATPASAKAENKVQADTTIQNKNTNRVEADTLMISITDSTLNFPIIINPSN
jgi:hypothetical protein